MTGTPSQVMDELKEIARKKGSAYLVTCAKFRSDTYELVEEGHVAITPGLSLEEAFEIAAAHPDLEGHFLGVRSVYDLAAGRELEGYPTVIHAAKPAAGV